MNGMVVLGVGNVLMGDEGVGVRAVEALAEDPSAPGGVRFIDGGTSTHALLEDLEGLELLVIVDAVKSGRRPGSVTVYEGDAVPSAFSNKLSPHQHGINDLLAQLRFLGRAPKWCFLVGVEPERIALGLELSTAAAGALPEVKKRVLAILDAI